MVEVSTDKNTRYRQALWESAKKMGFPAALWRLPKTNEKYFLTNFTEKPASVRIDLEELGAGFAFSPFDNPENSETLFLSADLCYVFDENEDFDAFIRPNSLNPIYSNFQSALEVELSKNKAESSPQPIETRFDTSQENRFISLVKKGIASIQTGEMQKVVLSRTKEIILPLGFDTVKAFDKFCTAYPNAFVSAVSIPVLGVVWMCASPERLVSQDKNGIFKTMALAGTQSAFDANGQAIIPSEAMWRQKEIEEQSLVCRYIINCFKKIRLREYDEDGPKTAIAGNLMHLQTDFTVDTQFVNYPQLASVMLGLLHPTSAVCGMPKKPATQFIIENEGFDREFYSGFLGPINIQQESHIFVNLRTMKMQAEKATLYAGCGITADSNPMKEWQETEMKCQTLLNVLQKSNS